MSINRWLIINRKMILFCALAVTLALVVACGSAAPATPAPATAAPQGSGAAAPTATPQSQAPPSGPSGAGKAATILITNLGNGRFDPLLADGEDLKFQRMFNQALVGGKGGSELTPAIAKSWELSADGRSWVFTINEGFIKFHNGDTLTAQDVFFSLDSRGGVEGRQLLEQGVYEPRDFAEFQLVESISKGPGPDQVTVRWKLPRPDFAFNWSENSQGPTPMITSEAYFREVGGIPGYERAPVGAGPMTFTDSVPEQRYTFERFDDYFWRPGNGFDEDRRVNFETLTIEVVPEDSTRVAALRAGDADLVEGNILMVDQIKDFGNDYQIAWQNESSYNWVVFVDCWNPSMWCFQKEVRQAAEMAIDKDVIVNDLYSPESVVAGGWGHVTPNSLGWTEELRPFAYDPEGAKALLASVGFKDGKDANGKQVSFTINTWEAGDLPFLPQLAELYKDFWEDTFGWQVEVSVGDASATRQQWNNRQLAGNVLVRTNEARYDGTSIATGGWNNPDIAWRAVEHPDKEPWASTTVPVVRNGLADINPATRQQTFAKMYQALRDEHMWGDGFHTNLPWGMGPRVTEYRPWTLVPYITAIWTVKLK